MSVISLIARKTFGKIFNNLAAEIGCPVESVQLGIYYPADVQGCKYEVYENFVKLKDIELDAYTGVGIDFTGGTAAIDMTISQAGPRFAKEISEATKESIEAKDVNIIMRYREKELPDAVLMYSGKKHRMIDIKKEFLNN